ncbi:LysR family transcriptional regulator [Pigmentiphaga soli]|uniref:LysR family transcriptional regulator n=1 Tax=Pigmentiphaga soli TaxID=1007095 RepID=A0ABP8HPC0_9BURK
MKNVKIPSTTLEQWQLLQAVVECGGYAQAAEALGRSQSSVSYMVARLQEQLGVPLLAIEGRKARLTANGRILLSHAQHVLAGAHRLEDLAASLERGWEAELRLAVDVAFPTPRLLLALAAFAASAPQTRIQLMEVVLSGADEALLAKAADVVVGTRIPPGHLGDPLAQIEFVAVAHPGHPLHRLERPLSGEDLKDHLQIVLRDSGTRSPRDDGWLGSTQRWTVTSMETSAAMVAAGLGYAWLPCHLVTAAIARGAMKPLPLEQGATRRVPLYLIFAAGVRIGPAARRLVQVLEEAAAAPEPPAIA